MFLPALEVFMTEDFEQDEDVCASMYCWLCSVRV